LDMFGKKTDFTETRLLHYVHVIISSLLGNEIIAPAHCKAWAPQTLVNLIFSFSVTWLASMSFILLGVIFCSAKENNKPPTKALPAAIVLC
jgi:hypothetical protein